MWARRRRRQADGSAQSRSSCGCSRRRLRVRGRSPRGTSRARRRRAIEVPRTSCRPAGWDRLADASKTISPRATGSSSMWQPAGRNGKSASTWRSTSRRAAAEQRAEACGRSGTRVRWWPTKSSTVQSVLAVGAAQAAAELLQEERRALGRAQQQQRVDVRDVDALVEQVDGEHDVDSSRRRGRAAPPVRSSVGTVAPDRHGRNPGRAGTARP